MNCRERFLAALKGQKPDRPPVAHVSALTTVELQEITGCRMPEVHLDAEQLARLCYANHQVLGFDAVTFNITYFGEPAALGSEIDWGDQVTYPRYGSPIWKEPEDAVIPEDLLDRQPIRTYLQATRIARRDYGDHVGVIAKVMGPLSMVQAMHGLDNTMVGMIENPDKIRYFLEISAQILAKCANAEFEEGADAVAIGEGGAGGNMLSPHMHERFLLNVHKQMIARISGPTIMHICGDITPRLDALSQIGLCCFNFDWAIAPKLMKDKAAGAFSLMGNINTTDLLLGQPEEIERQVVENLEAGIDIISPGCAISPRCSNANLKAMVSAVTKRYRDRSQVGRREGSPSMAKPTDVRPASVSLYFLPVKTRIPLKFGPETLTHVTCARVRMVVRDRRGQEATGWGETPLSVQWVWPNGLSFGERHETLQHFTQILARAWAEFANFGHPLEVGHRFQHQVLPDLVRHLNQGRGQEVEPMPWLAALVCCSAFDIALHDAYGQLIGRPTYETYHPELMNDDLAAYLSPAAGSDTSFKSRYPQDYLVYPRPNRLRAWHLVGGLDLLDASELTGSEPDDGYPIVLSDWIARDGLKCLKVKLRGNDARWDYQRLVRVGQIGLASGVEWLSSDFNCTVTDPDYVNEILDRLFVEHPRIYNMVLYVEQPFPYDLESHRINVHSVSARKPLFMDESAHDWKLVRLGRELGWSGVALKTCKTQTGALLSLCWAKAHGMALMVQDLTNPMLAQIPHVLLAAHAGTIMGVETNAMQFYPDASLAEEAVHPGLYRRCEGQVDLSTIQGPGFGYRLDEIARKLPVPATRQGEA